MTAKIIGGILVTFSCAFLGFAVAGSQQQEMGLLEQLLKLLQYCEDQLRFRLTPLPQLMLLAGEQTNGRLRHIFEALAACLDAQCCCNGRECMEKVLQHTQNLPQSVRQQLMDMGTSLGIMDLDGQIAGFALVKENCKQELQSLRYHQKERLRSIRTLGICAGVGIAVILM